MTPVSEGGGFSDISVEKAGSGYEELCRDRERRKALSGNAAGEQRAETSTNKELYLKNKKETADRRNAEKRLERLRKEAAKIEEQIDAIDTEMNGSAATDYARLSELDEKKNALEERLLEIYGEI